MFGVAMETGYGRQFPAKSALSPESAVAADIFDQFVTAQTLKSVLGTFRVLCDTLRLKPTTFPLFYPKLKAKLRSWKAQALWSKFDKRAAHKCYNRARACAHSRVLIIGGGPCGLRTAIEAQLLGAKVVVIEKRDRISRNNVLHLWPFVMHDLRALGGKKFFGKFCAGTIDHISIRQLQCILLKVALLLGVEIHENVAFESIKEPPNNQSEEKIGWRASITPEDHPVSQYEFDILIGADGKRNTLQGFRRKEFRGKLAIAITANFINYHSEAEARVEEISGVAFIFNQKFFQDMREQTGIDLENIVYYKDDTHYFVMTAKKQSLFEKGVIIEDFSDTAKLLAPDNVNREALMEYAREAADFATNCQLPCLEFAVNHYGQADVAMFDFTSMYAAESACKVIEKRGHRLLMGLVGDSLLEPFWPTGSGCARGFLSSLDACWMMRSWSMGTMTPLQVLAERESIYRLLAQTTPENLNKDYSELTLNPQSRYPNLNLHAVRPIQVRSLYDSDVPVTDEHLELPIEMPKKKRKKDSIIHPDTLLMWCKKQVALYDNVVIEDLTSSWKNGLALCAIIHHYRPDLVDYNSLTEEDIAKNNQLAFNICEQEFGISPIMTGQEMADCSVPDKLSMVSYVNQLYDTFRGEIPHVARNTVDLSPDDKLSSPPSGRRTPGNRLSLLTRLSHALTVKKQRLHNAERMERERGVQDRFDRRAKKRRSLDKERALFILNNNEQKPTHLPNLPKSGAEKIPFSDRIKTLEGLLMGQPSYERGGKNDAGLIYHLTPSEMEAKFSKPCVNAAAKLNKVGRLEKGDWNVKMLEERLKERQAGGKKESETIPKWNRNCFEDKLRAMDCKLNNAGTEDVEKFIDFDQRIRALDQKLKEGTALERGQRGSNKVSAMAEQLAAILEPKQEHPPLVRSNSRPNIGSARGGSETCHFCSKRVYLMERMSAQGKFFHRGCFKCEYCGTALRLGSYGYAADGNFGGKFLCMQHFGMPLLSPRKRPADAISLKEKIAGGTPAKMLAAEKIQSLSAQKVFLDVSDAILMRGATPERVEFENSLLDLASEEEILSEIDEDEWTDRNFGTTTTTDLDSTDEDESDFSSEEISEDDQVFEEVFQRSFTSDETRRLAESWKCRYSQGKKVDKDGVEIEESDEEYGESDDEFSYQAYEDDGIIQEESSEDEDEDKPSSASSTSEKLKVLSARQENVQAIDEVEVVVLASDQDTEDDTEVGTDESSSDEYSESADDDKVNSSMTHNIPSIVINESPPNQLELEEEDIFYKSLQQQKQPLIGDSVASTPMTEDERPICKMSPSASYYALDELLSELPTPNDESAQISIETPIAPTDGEEFAESVFADDEALSESIEEDEPKKTKLSSPEDESEVISATHDIDLVTPVMEEEHATTHGVEQCMDLIESQNHKDFGQESTVANEIVADKTVKFSETENEDKVPANIISFSESDDRDVKLRFRNSQSVDRDLMTKSVIEPLERCSNDEFSNVEPIVCEEVVPVDAKPLEPALSLPNLAENIPETTPVEDKMTQKILKLKERYLLGESNGFVPTNKNAEVKVSPAKIEPVVKSVLEMITEKQKMLSPVPSLPMSIRSLTESSSDKLFSGSLPKSYKLHQPRLLGLNLVKHDELKDQQNANTLLADKVPNPIEESENSETANKNLCRELFPEDSSSCDNSVEIVNGSSIEPGNLDGDKPIESKVIEEDVCTELEKDVMNAEIKEDGNKVENADETSPEFSVDTTFVTFRHKRVHSKSDSFLDACSEDTSLNTSDSVNNNVTVSDDSFNKSTPKDVPKTEEMPTTTQKQVSPNYKYEGRFSQKFAPMDNIRALIERKRSSTEVSKIADMTNDEEKVNANIITTQVITEPERTSVLQVVQNVSKPVLRLQQSESKTQDRRSIHEEIEEIPFADDENNVDNATPRVKSKFYTPKTSFKKPPSKSVKHDDSSGDLFYTPCGGDNGKDLRTIKTVERERARQEARERARLKSDEELGLSPALYPNLLRKGSKDGDIINGNVKSDEELNSGGSSSGSSSDASKTDGGHYLETELSVDDTDLPTSPTKGKGPAWTGFGMKTKSQKSEESSKMKMKDHRRGLLSLFASFTKMEPVKARGKENSRKSASKMSSPDSETGAKEKFSRLKLSRSKEKIKEKEHDGRRKTLPKTPSKEEVRCLKEINKPKLEGFRPERPKELILDKTKLRHNMAEMMQPSRLLQACSSNSAPRASEDSFSESDDDDAGGGNATGTIKRAKEITEEKLRKLQRIAQRVYRQQEQKRLRMAQEIQRQLEELEVKQHELEERGVHVEKALRGEGEDADKQKEEGELMQEWFHLVHEKNVLVRYEQELMVRAKELELEDRHSRLQQSLREKMAIDDSLKSQEQIDEEGHILTEMLEIVEQRDALVAMLEEDRRRYEVEDEDLETSLLAKGYNLSPPSKT